MTRKTNRREFFGRASLLAVGLAAGERASAEQAKAAAPIERKGRSRIKLSMAAYSFRQYLTAKENPMTLFDFIDLCAELGLDGTELTCYYFPRDPTPEYFAQIKRRAFLNGLDVSGTAVSNRFALPPGKEREGQIAYVKKWVDYAAAMGAGVIRVYSGAQPKGASLEQAQNWAAECFQETCDYAGQKGTFLALENHGGISVGADLLLALVEKVKSPWFGILMDTGNFQTKDPYKDMERVAPYTVTVQCKTDLRPEGGQRQPMDYDRVISILRGVNYSGYIALEYEAKEDPKTGAPKAIEQLRKALQRAWKV
ncbi:sugar phosphate isomerase/epimerase [Candidatus Sumerlaeota bacterium]|nr:sugar phosphate isomerase/epimerase [Candidatus Sumerlaeota bacterium]